MPTGPCRDTLLRALHLHRHALTQLRFSVPGVSATYRRVILRFVFGSIPYLLNRLVSFADRPTQLRLPYSSLRLSIRHLILLVMDGLSPPMPRVLFRLLNLKTTIQTSNRRNRHRRTHRNGNGRSFYDFRHHCLRS